MPNTPAQIHTRTPLRTPPGMPINPRASVGSAVLILLLAGTPTAPLQAQPRIEPVPQPIQPAPQAEPQAEPETEPGSGAEAEAEPSGTQDPELLDESIEDRFDSIESRPRAEPIFPTLEPRSVPVSAGDAGLIESVEALDPRSIVGRSLPEGTVLPLQGATIVTAPTGEIIAVFHRLPDGSRRTPMVLLPCRVLERLIATDARAEAPLRVALTGAVTLYRGRNYLMPTSFSVLPEASMRPAPQPSAPDPDALDASLATPGDADSGLVDDGATEAAEPPRVAVQDDPDVQALIGELEQRRVLPRALSREAQAGPASGPASGGAMPGGETGAAARAVPPQPEGTFLIGRRGRLARAAGGEWLFTFDNDHEPIGDAPAVVLPGRALQQIEGLTRRVRDDHPFVLSGQLYTFAGRTYLMPTLIRQVRGDDVSSLQ